jgi:REP element-mobilizing transposase RayT
MDRKEIYRRNLPHFHLSGQTYFITWMLSGSLPKSVLSRMDLEYKKMKSSLQDEKLPKKNIRKLKTRNYIKSFDNELHSTGISKYYLRKPEIAKITADSIHYWDNIKYNLLTYCIMPNHVHTVLTTFEKDEDGKIIYLQDILESIKKYSARRCNKQLKRRGKFWQHESFDRIIRDREDLYWTLLYVIENPVNAGMCKTWQDFEWTYLHSKYHESMESDSLSR